MKKLLSALIILALCLSPALAVEGDPAAAGAPEVEVVPAGEPVAPEPEPDPEPEPEPEPEPVPEPEPQPQPPVQEEDPPADAPATDAPATDAPATDAPVSDAPAMDAPTTEEPAEGEAGEGETAGDGPATLEGPGLNGLALFDVLQLEGAEAYVEGGKPGKLAEILAQSGQKTVYVMAKEPVKIPDFPLALLKEVTFVPAPEAYKEAEKYIVVLKSGEEEITAEMIEAADSETVELTIAVEEKTEDPGANPDPQKPGGSGGDAEVQITVQAPGYEEGVWKNSYEFYLSGIPDESYSYIALIYDERFIPLSAGVYVPNEEGEYTVRFAIQDRDGKVVASSEKYNLMLDATAPQMKIEVSETKDYTMTINGSDELSGVKDYSLDGGEKWLPVELREGLGIEVYDFQRKVYDPETILLRDRADNVSGNEEEVVLDVAPTPEPMEDFGFDYGGYGGEPKPTAEPHAKGDGDTSPYDAYEMKLPEGPVDALTLGGEAIDLGLEVADAPDEKGKFTAELTTWAVDNPGVADMPGNKPKDTLIVRAEGAAAGDYTWRINGAVLRKLYNSDIAYLLLRAGDAALALPTVGFTAGTRYAELKMEGTSTAEFEYEIVMHVDPEAGAEVAPDADGWNLSGNCEVEFFVEVAGERYSMVDRQNTPEMYPFDVYCGPADMPAYPYGAYPVAGTEE